MIKMELGQKKWSRDGRARRQSRAPDNSSRRVMLIELRQSADNAPGVVQSQTRYRQRARVFGA